MLPAERIVAVQTGCCPHTAIRDDITINLEAVEELERDQGPLDLVLVESGGDNLTAVFSPALADVQIFVIDVAGGDDIPRKGGPGIARADLLVINKTDLAPYVGSDVERMLARRARAPRRRCRCTRCRSSRRRRRAPVADWIARAARARSPPPAGTCTRASSGAPDHAPRSRARALSPPRGACSAIERTRRPRGRASCAADTRLAPRILGRGAGAVRAAFVPTQAGPLAGDRDRARIVVGAGATLVVEPVAATLALPGAARTRADARRRPSSAGGRLVLDEAPLIVAAGADVERRCTIELGAGAVAALRETVVLGRDGEPPGTLDELAARDARRPRAAARRAAR